MTAATTSVPLIGGSLTDELVHSARAGNPRAWDVAYHDIAPRLRGYLRGVQAADVDDVIGETFTRMVRSIGSFEGGANELRAWAYAIARNARTDQARAAARQTLDADAGDTMQLPDHAGDVVADVRVRELLAELTDRQREVMVLRIVGDLTVEQVAYVMGDSVGSIKQLQRRALKLLRGRVAV
jgi:RNA polymerase sigma-70 factor (ECF subfamily)